MATTTDSASKIVTAQCYCKSLHFTLDLPTANLPLPVHLCHCSTCRYTHGTLCIFHAPLPEGVEPQFVSPSGLDKLTGYAGPGSTRYFCSTCGCHMGDVDPGDGKWVISTSLFAKDESVFQIKTHVFTESAPGGGLNDWLPRIGDREMRVWNPKDGTAAPVESEPEVGPDGADRLRAQCHCGGVSFTFPRPTREVLDDPILKRYVSPLDDKKWAACVDACDDCRGVSGSHYIAWTFVPLALCEPRIGLDLAIGTNKTFASSPGVLRSFCGVCGATVFYSCDERRPSYGQAVVDVAVGLLRAPEGVKADGWLTWRAGRASWLESGLRYDEELTKSLADGMAKWSEEKVGSVPNFDIGT